MEYTINKSIEILNRTPVVLETLLKDLPTDWLMNNEGENTWSPYDVVGHLIHGEKTDWIARMEIILQEGGEGKFEPYDRFAQFKESKGKSMTDLLNEFKIAREKNMEILLSKNIGEADLGKTGIHPTFGIVTLRQLLATWVVHDLGHIAQVTRVMAKQYKEEVGPWINYMNVLTRG